MAMFGNHVAVFRNSLGIFKKGWKRPFFTALLNIVFSVWLTIKFGLIGTLFGTTLARFFTLHWYDPWIVCKYGFDEKPIKYYFRFVLYIFIIFVSSTILLYTKNLLPNPKDFFDFLWQGTFYLIAAIVVTFGIGFLFPEQKPLLSRITKLIKSH